MSMITRTLAVASLVLATVVAGPNPAAGLELGYESRNGVCELFELCLYSGENQTGSVYDFALCENASSYIGRQMFNPPLGLDDTVESARNRTGFSYDLYLGSQFSGSNLRIPPDLVELDVLPLVSNQVSSHKCVSGSASYSYEARNGVCEPGELCVYQFSNQGGGIYDFGLCESASGYFGRKFFNSPSSLNNKIDSVWNRSGVSYRFYVDDDFEGVYESIRPVPELQELGPVDDKGSSHLCTELA